MIRNLLYEMAVQKEQDVFAMEPVASVTSEVTDTLEGAELRKYVFQIIQPKISNPKYTVTEHDIGVLIRHHCGYRKLKKAALLALPYIINANIVTASWENNVKIDDEGNPIDGDKRQSGMISAPILIDGVKYLCNLTSKKNGKKKVTPYALALKDENGELVEAEKMVGIPSSVPHSSSEPTAIRDVHSVKATTSHDTNPSFQGAKVQQNIELNKNNGIKTEQYMNKKQIRLTESDLKQIVKESIDKILNEAYGTPSKQDRETLDGLDSFPYRGSSSSTFKGTMKVGELINDLEDAIRSMIWKDETYYNDASIKTRQRHFSEPYPNIRKYEDALTKKLEEMKKIYSLLLSKLKQTSGEQPNSEYYDKHLSRSKRIANMQNLNGREDRGDYSGLSGWGG